MTGNSFSTDYEMISGTSMAAPHVTGAVALLCSIAPYATADQVRDAILNGVDPIDMPQYKETVTNGRLNLAGAITALDFRIGSSDPVAGNTFHTCPPTDFTIVFSEPFDPGSIITDPSDIHYLLKGFLFNGVTAYDYDLTSEYSVTYDLDLVDNCFITFHFSNDAGTSPKSPVAVTPLGEQSMSFEAGFVSRTRDPEGNQPWNVTFTYHELTASDDCLVANEDEPLEILISSLTNNDLQQIPLSGNAVYFVEGDFQLPVRTLYGTVTLLNPQPASGPTLLYEPDPDFRGVDTFTYSLTDGGDYYDEATVSIIVVRTEFKMLSGETLNGTLAPGAETGVLVFDNWIEPAHAGQWVVQSDGTFTYQPTAGWTGVDRFKVRYSGLGVTRTLTVPIHVCEVVYPTVEFIHADEQMATETYWGGSVAIDEDEFIAGMRCTADTMEHEYATVLIYRDTTQGSAPWQQIADLPDPNDPYDQEFECFGWSVAISGDTAVVGAKWAGDSWWSPGKVYVYQRNGTQWDYVITLQEGADTPEPDKLAFGTSVAINEEADTIVVGAPGYTVDDSWPPQSETGAVYVYSFDQTLGWQKKQKLLADESAIQNYLTVGDMFGSSVSISGDTILIGAEGAGPNSSIDPGATGAAYVSTFDNETDQWSLPTRLPVIGLEDFAHFGYSVAVDGDVAAIGAYGTTDGQGAVYLFERTAPCGPWQAVGANPITLGAEAVANDRFGSCVDITADCGDVSIIVVGAPGRDFSTGDNAGAIFVYQYDGIAVSLIGTTCMDEAGQELGTSVAVDGTSVVAGAPGYDTTRGAVYTFGYNHTPVAEDLEFWVPPDTALEDMQLFGIDPYEGSPVDYLLWDGDSWSNSGSITTAGGGSVTFDTNTGLFDYTPAGQYYGKDSFSYIVNDGAANSNEATVMLVVAIPGDATLDGEVDGNDSQRVAENWGATTFNTAYETWWEMGDFDGDNVVGPRDSAILGAHWHYEYVAGEGAMLLEVAGQYLYHKLDGNNDPIIEPDMTVTGYSKGLVGIVIDVSEVLDGQTIDASDFIFKVGNTSDPSTWSTAPAPSAVIVHEDEGANGADRIEIRWADYSILDQWLEVTIDPEGDVLLAHDYTQYFGALRGDTDSDGDVDVVDFDNFGTGYYAGTTDQGFAEGDFDLDGDVDGSDLGTFAAGWFGDPLVDLNAAEVVAQYLYHELDGGDNPIVEEGMTVTGYVHGIVGVAIDIDDLPSHINPANISATDFLFQLYDPDEDEWVTAPAPASITVHLNEGVDGADRIAITWADDSIVAEYLRVAVLDSVLGSEEPGVADEHDFIFGSLPGDATGDGIVDIFDQAILGVNYNQQGDFGIAGADLNLDGVVDGIDVAIMAAYYNQQLEDPED
ncbi:MAG: cadherin-like domain-containing protein [Pirellulales bacterium]|nr:cadherin-like domain-containing protein [Pirellulales bacterium]